MIQRVRISAISDLKEFTGKDQDEDRASAWIGKVKYERRVFKVNSTAANSGTVAYYPMPDATDGLGGQKYPTLAIAVPVLRSIERKLKNEKFIRSVGNEEFRRVMGRIDENMWITKLKLWKIKI
ncbi:Hypothetical protein PHPALM_933 [Phytophthora palmivora]|uniref:Uncharacterized protein n=1 Tax=Phytophthora palmivora TaxID=4796 RepID=A0A2P4YTM8_9STRA|nr:Hypothetical protein PHPALM_933 [Phytophthora palmivora]